MQYHSFLLLFAGVTFFLLLYFRERETAHGTLTACRCL